jgi:hypothetical protein
MPLRGTTTYENSYFPSPLRGAGQRGPHKSIFELTKTHLLNSYELSKGGVMSVLVFTIPLQIVCL